MSTGVGDDPSGSRLREENGTGIEPDEKAIVKTFQAKTRCKPIELDFRKLFAERRRAIAMAPETVASMSPLGTALHFARHIATCAKY